MPNEEKLNIVKENLEELAEQIDNANRAAGEAQSDANSHIGAMASRYDTFKEEAQYMSAAQRLRIRELCALEQKTRLLYEDLQKQPANHETVKVGSLVTIATENDDKMNYLILFYGSARQVECCSRPTTIIGAASPIARSILGLGLGDEVEIRLPQKNIRAEILDIN